MKSNLNQKLMISRCSCSKLNSQNNKQHNRLSWMMCYDDQCMIHLFKKNEKWHSHFIYTSVIYRHISYRKCKKVSCLNHLLNKIYNKQKQTTHRILDWALCSQLMSCRDHSNLIDTHSKTCFEKKFQKFMKMEKDKHLQ